MTTRDGGFAVWRRIDTVYGRASWGLIEQRVIVRTAYGSKSAPLQTGADPNDVVRGLIRALAIENGAKPKRLSDRSNLGG